MKRYSCAVLLTVLLSAVLIWATSNVVNALEPLSPQQLAAVQGECGGGHGCSGTKACPDYNCTFFAGDLWQKWKPIYHPICAGGTDLWCFNWTYYVCAQQWFYDDETCNLNPRPVPDAYNHEWGCTK